MSIMDVRPTDVGAPGESGNSDRQFAELRSELRRQGDRITGAQRAFSIFAVAALLLGMGTFLAVAFKMDRHMRTVTVAAPAAAVAPAAAKAAAPALPDTVSVGLREFVVDPSATTAAAGKVTFNVKNSGTVTHEFVVIRTDKPAADLLKGARADETGNVGETGDLAPGAAKTIALKLTAGHYALICNLPGHYSAGQHTDFTVK
jgi:uncharacterized cupredoxin-like copper-binding protein